MSLDPEARARLSPYERAVNRLNDLPRGLDRIFTEALEDMRAQRDTARAEGVAAERARVVADLRKLAAGFRTVPLPGFSGLTTLCDETADRYERGEHDKPASRKTCAGCQGRGGSFEPSIAHTDRWVVCDVCGGRGEHDKEGA